MKLIAIGGMPGTGKSRVMREVMKQSGLPLVAFRYGQVRGYQAGSVYVLGVYEKGITSGTDRLSMSVQPDAYKFVSGLKREGVTTVLFEGDRLFNNSFLVSCAEFADVKLFHLVAADSVLQNRYGERQSSQSTEWIAGRRTKIANVLAAFPQALTFCNESELELSVIVKAILAEIPGSGNT